MEKTNASTYNTLDDIVFEGRNKSYGAYILRKIYDKHVLIALFLVAFVFAGLIASVWINELMKEEVIEAPEEEAPVADTYVDVVLPPTKQEVAIIQEPPNIKKFQFTEYVPEEDNKVTTPPKSNDELLNKNLSTENKDGKDTSVAQGGGQTPTNTPENVGGTGPSDDFAETYQVHPVPSVNLMQYINSRLSERTREYISEKGINGRLMVTIIVLNDGSIGGATLLKGLADCKPCNEEIPEILKNMPAWKPAENNGYKVKVRMNVPIKFNAK